MLPGKNDTYRLLAAAPAQKGIASLRYDKRGIAASAGAMVAEQDLRFEMYVNGPQHGCGNCARINGSRKRPLPDTAKAR
jgi:hypothetical protein